MKILIQSIGIVFMLMYFAACDADGNTGNGADDTPVRHGSGYSDTTDPGRGTLDTTFTPSEDNKHYERDNR